VAATFSRRNFVGNPEGPTKGICPAKRIYPVA
jgi:hypothetical protein